MKVCHPSENYTSLNSLILQLQLMLELSLIQEILSTYTELFLLFAEYPYLFNFFKNEPIPLKGENKLFYNNFITQDPARDGGNWYGYCGNSPLTSIDLTGLKEEKKFALRHPIVAIKTGIPKDGRRNINSAPSNFAINMKFEKFEFGEVEIDQGSKKGAFRHVLWQSILTSKFDSSIAEEIGNVHESVTPNALINYENLEEADTRCDQLNNVIGRRIGKNKPYKPTNLAKECLYEFYTNGLYTVEQNQDKTFSVVITKNFRGRIFYKTRNLRKIR